MRRVKLSGLFMGVILGITAMVGPAMPAHANTTTDVITHDMTFQDLWEKAGMERPLESRVSVVYAVGFNRTMSAEEAAARVLRGEYEGLGVVRADELSPVDTVGGVLARSEEVIYSGPDFEITVIFDDDGSSVIWTCTFLSDGGSWCEGERVPA